MRAGIIAEGKTDLAVIQNVLKGRLGIDRSDVQFFAPELRYDETDLSQMRKEEFSNWTIVKSHCEERAIIREFLDNPIDDARFFVLQIDTAERLEPNFEVPDPPKTNDENYVETVREAVFLKMSDWLECEFVEKIAFAIAVEETDAWILANFEKSETGHHIDPKGRLKKLINGPNSMFKTEKQRKQHFQKDAFEQAAELSDDFRKPKKLEAAAAKNASLKLFCADLDKFKI